MTRKQDNAKKANWKELMKEQEDFLRPLIREVLQEVLEVEMEEALGAEKGERTASLPFGILRPDPGHAGGETGAKGAAGPSRPLPDGGVRAISAQ
jgi:transposase-like protein